MQIPLPYKLAGVTGAVLLAAAVFAPTDKKVDPPIKPEAPSTYAEIDENGEVLRVIVITEEMIQTGKWGDPDNWVRTYDDGRRNVYAGKGDKYDRENDAFIQKKPFDSWVLNERLRWEPPVKKPTDGKRYLWNEDVKQWKEQRADRL